MKAAVLLLAWRRPHTTLKVLQTIREYAPTRFYVACDGALFGRPDESRKVEATRQLIEQNIDWDCQVQRLFNDTNYGCCRAVSRAISWFFEQEEEGIILEDDCVPHADFFSYCNTLLERHRDDERIWCISGNNFQDGQWRGDGAYYFSRYPHCWGWASWRRCWQHYDGELSLWPRMRESGLLEAIFPTPEERGYWTGVWDKLYQNNDPDSWAYRWIFTCISMGGITVLPNRNLVSNIGFGPDATHTTDSRVTYRMQDGPSEWVQPSFVLVDREADFYTFYHYIAGQSMRYQASFKGSLLDPFLARIRIAVQHPAHYPRKLIRLLASRRPSSG